MFQVSFLLEKPAKTEHGELISLLASGNSLLKLREQIKTFIHTLLPPQCYVGEKQTKGLLFLKMTIGFYPPTCNQPFQSPMCYGVSFLVLYLRIRLCKQNNFLYHMRICSIEHPCHFKCLALYEHLPEIILHHVIKSSLQNQILGSCSFRLQLVEGVRMIQSNF